MKLAYRDQTLKLRIDGYQFPELHDVEWDSDWLNIHFSLGLPELHWETRAPSLTTFEIQELIDWLEEMATYHEDSQDSCCHIVSSRISFTEPNLSFEVILASDEETDLTFRIHLAAEHLPPFQDQLSGYQPDMEVQEVWTDFPSGANDLRDMAHSLQQQLAQHPVRVGLRDSNREGMEESDAPC